MSLLKKFDLTGQRFKRLSVLYRVVCPPSYSQTWASRRSFWLCRCDCGKEIIVPSFSLKNGQTKSCGCWRSDVLKNRGFQTPGLSGLNKIYRRYQTVSKRRGHLFSLSKEKFKELTSLNCFYCGLPPSLIADSKDTKGMLPERVIFGRYLYSSLDRIDSQRGYEEGNVVPCCVYCNRMKNDLTLRDFYIRIEKIYNNPQIKQLIEKISI